MYSILSPISIAAIICSGMAGIIISINYHFKIKKDHKKRTEAALDILLIAYIILICIDPIPFERIVPKRFLTDSVISSKIFYNVITGIVTLMASSMFATQVIMLFFRRK